MSRLELIKNRFYMIEENQSIGVYDKYRPNPRRFGEVLGDNHIQLARYFASDFCCDLTFQRWVINRTHLLNTYGWNYEKGTYFYPPKYPTDLPPICNCKDWKHSEGWKNSSGASIPFTPENLVGKTITLPSLPADAAIDDLTERIRTLERAYEYLQKKG